MPRAKPRIGQKPVEPKPSRDRVKAHRDRMRAKGMRLVQVWLPDTTTPEFRAEARRQARLINESPTAKDDQAFIDSVASIWSEDA
jgi:hypothetical protein